MTTDAMAAEFGDVADWTADAVEQLGAGHAIPAACRGSASPAALAWLAEACELAPGQTLLDAGAGVGGPAAWVAERFGVRPILVEPMVSACRAADRLFGLPVVAAAGGQLPLRSGSADVGWCLGVLCTVEDKKAVLDELHRVLKPRASLGLLVVVARAARHLPAPDGNHFPTQRELAGVLANAGFDLLEQIECRNTAPLSWSRRADQVASAVAAKHQTDQAYALAERQTERMDRLRAARQVSLQLLHAVAA
jgi:SAM-dependent methyltransferase